jgi:hypothetical protein
MVLRLRSAAEAFVGEEDAAAEAAFDAALKVFLDKHDKMFHQPRIHQKPISLYVLWKLVMGSGGFEKVRTCFVHVGRCQKSAAAVFYSTHHQHVCAVCPIPITNKIKLPCVMLVTCTAQVTEKKLWARIARILGAPESMTDKSTVIKKNYALSLLDFEQVTACLVWGFCCLMDSVSRHGAWLMVWACTCMLVSVNTHHLPAIATSFHSSSFCKRMLSGHPHALAPPVFGRPSLIADRMH